MQRLKKAIEKTGAKPDLEIFRLLARALGLTPAAAAPVEIAAAATGGVRSAGDTLFTSGTLGRYSKMLNAVTEAPGELYRG